MGKYDFTSLPNRLGHHTYKWKEAETDSEVLPAWIADMDFVVLPEIRQAVQTYADQLVYGYTYASEELIKEVQKWEAIQHSYHFDKEALVFIEGVVPAISTAIQAFTKEGEAVLINTPVYPPFARSVKLNNRRLITNSLVEKDGLFEIDFVQLEKDLVEEDVKLYILCNPHNPGGRVWEKEVLEKIGQLCQKHGVFLISDEIHQDLALFGHKHQSFNTIDPAFKDFALILSSATKTFNIAGTKNSYAVIENPKLRVAFQKRQLANLLQHFFFPNTSTRVVRVAENIKFDILFYQFLFQLVKINLKQPILFHQRIGNQSAIVQFDTAGKRWIDRCVNQDSLTFFCKGLNSC